MKKLVTWAALGLAAWWAVKDPTAAAHLLHGISGMFNAAASAVSTIFSAS